MSGYHLHPGVHLGQKSASDPLELEFQMFTSHVGTVNQLSSLEEQTVILTKLSLKFPPNLMLLITNLF